MKHTPRRAVIAVIIGCSMAMLASCGTPASVATPKLHLQAVDVVRVISPHLSAAQIDGLVPKGHYSGILAGAVTTCGTEGVDLTPAEMALKPVDVTLWHEGKRISAVRLARRSGFAFLIVGGTIVHFKHNPNTHEQPSGWAPSFMIRTSSGFSSSAGLGGLGGAGEEVFQVPARPHFHPCYPGRPSIPDNNRVSIGQACVQLSANIDGQVSPATGEHAVMVALTNEESHRCQLYGYPMITLANATRELPNGTVMPSPHGVIPFSVVHRSLYTSNRPPSVVTLAPGDRAYVEVTKYRCDGRELKRATILTLNAPISGQILALMLPPGEGVGTFAYCQGGPQDPGNFVSVTPVSTSVRSLVTR
jgi:Protein of unknown function (DUF4232)